MEKRVYIISCDDLCEYLEENSGVSEFDFSKVDAKTYKEACLKYGWDLSFEEFVEEFNYDGDLASTTSYHFIKIL